MYDATFVLVEGREAWLTWLFYLELLWFLMKLSFLLSRRHFLTIGIML